MVPLVRFELTELLLLRESTLPICPQGQKMAPVEGIEPPLAVLETAALPLYYTGIVIGATGQIRTDGFRDLQSLALGLSATVACEIGGAYWIRTNDPGFCPDAFLAGKCLRPTRPTLR